MSLDLIDYTKLAAAMAPMLVAQQQEATKNLTEQIIPALGEQLKQGIQEAIVGLNTDSKAAIEEAADRIEKLIPQAVTNLEAAGERLLDKFFTELRKTSLTLGGV